MDHYSTTACLSDTAIDDMITDPDLLCDIDLPLCHHVDELRNADDLLDYIADDSLTAGSHNDTDERQKASDETIAISAARAFDSRGAPTRVGLQQNMSKNAISAREHREKKKRYICGLENTVRDLSAKNKKLVHDSISMRNMISKLHQEVNYLRGVIENQSELSRLLKRIPLVDPAHQLQENANLFLFGDESQERNASFCTDQRASASSLNSSELPRTELVPTADYQNFLTEHDYAKSFRQNKPNISSSGHFGVCLHVANRVTSLQLCASCNENAH